MAKRWTENDVKILKSDYGRLELSELANKLGRSADAVQWKASKLNISFTREITVEQYNSIENRLKDLERDVKEILEILKNNG